MLVRLHKPKDRVLQVLPLLIAKTISHMLSYFLKDSVEEIYGILGHPEDCKLFCYQFCFNLLSGGKAMELHLAAIDKLVDGYISPKMTLKWQVCLYDMHVEKMRVVLAQQRPSLAVQRRLSMVKLESLDDVEDKLKKTMQLQSASSQHGL